MTITQLKKNRWENNFGKQKNYFVWDKVRTIIICGRSGGDKETSKSLSGHAHPVKKTISRRNKLFN